MILLTIVLVFSVALILTLISTPIVRNIAIKKHFLDQPNTRKVHTIPVPLLGGLSIYFSLLIAALVGIVVAGIPITRMMISILSGMTILVVLGIVDDRRGMSLKIKLSGQILAACLVVFFGARVSFIPFEFFSIGVSIFWIVGMTNALNLLDNMDGITGGVACIASFAFCFFSLIIGQDLITIFSLALAGASLGYLRYNFSPASIFLGDAGSMMIGFLLAVFGLIVGNSQSSYIGLAIPILVLAFPIFDTSLVTITRLVDGRNVSQGGKDHSTHRIRMLIGSDEHTALIVYMANIALAGAAILLFFYFTLTTMIILVCSVAFIFSYLGIKLSKISVQPILAPSKQVKPLTSIHTYQIPAPRSEKTPV